MQQEVKDVIMTLTSEKVNNTYLFNKDESLKLVTYNLSLKPSNNCNNDKLNNNPVSINVNKEPYLIKWKQLFSFNNLIYKKRKCYLK
jgi:hypothetical protein